MRRVDKHEAEMPFLEHADVHRTHHLASSERIRFECHHSAGTPVAAPSAAHGLR